MKTWPPARPVPRAQWKFWLLIVALAIVTIVMFHIGLQLRWVTECRHREIEVTDKAIEAADEILECGTRIATALEQEKRDEVQLKKLLAERDGYEKKKEAYVAQKKYWDHISKTTWWFEKVTEPEPQ